MSRRASRERMSLQLRLEVLERCQRDRRRLASAALPGSDGRSSPPPPTDASLIESHDMDEGPAAPARTLSPTGYEAGKHARRSMRRRGAQGLAVRVWFHGVWGTRHWGP